MGFHFPGVGSLVVTVGAGQGCHPGCSLFAAVTTRVAHGAVDESRSWVRRAWRVIRAATLNIRKRKRLGSPAPCLVVGEGDHLGPGGEFGGELDQGAPDAVLIESVQRQIC